MSEEQALNYLSLRKIEEKQAAEIYELVGGRLMHLKSITQDIGPKRTLAGMCTACSPENGYFLTAFTDLRKILFNDARNELLSAGIYRGRRDQKAGAAVIRELLEKGSISFNDYLDRVVDADTGDRLLESNVFAFHINSGKVTFQSTMMRRYCEANRADWDDKVGSVELPKK